MTPVIIGIVVLALIALGCSCMMSMGAGGLAFMRTNKAESVDKKQEKTENGTANAEAAAKSQVTDSATDPAGQLSDATIDAEISGEDSQLTEEKERDASPDEIREAFEN